MQSWEGAQAGVSQPWSRGWGCSERGRPGAGLELATEGMWRGEGSWASVHSQAWKAVQAHQGRNGGVGASAAPSPGHF